jgi:hypothetical protein
MVVQWLRYCATNRKVAGSIPDGVIGIFHKISRVTRELLVGAHDKRSTFINRAV